MKRVKVTNKTKDISFESGTNGASNMQEYFDKMKHLDIQHMGDAWYEAGEEYDYDELRDMITITTLEDDLMEYTVELPEGESKFKVEKVK